MLCNGEVIAGTYQIIRPIGEGGAGLVYLAYHNNLQKQVVIKRLKKQFANYGNIRQEADILKELHHSNLPQVYDFIQLGDEIYTVIDYIDGNPMSDYIRQRVRFNEAQIIRWLGQMLDALDYLHTRPIPIIHCDIKPANIMIDKNGDSCLIDFNVSTGVDPAKKVLGYSPDYASPEQHYMAQLLSQGGDYRSVVIDQRSDIYSLGAAFFGFMTDDRYQGPEHAKALRYNVLLPYSEELLEIILKALAEDPRERYQSAAEMKTDLMTIKLRDREYLAFQRAQTVFTAVFLTMFFIGVALTGYSVVNSNISRFYDDFHYIHSAYIKEDYQTVINDGIRALNNRSYSMALNRDEVSKAQLLYLIGDSILLTSTEENADDYSVAIDYLEESWEINRADFECACVYGLALQKDGRLDEASEIYQDTIKRCKNEELIRRAGRLWSILEQDRRQYEKAVQVLDDTASRARDDGSRSMLRRRAEVYISAAQYSESGKTSGFTTEFKENAISICGNLAEISGDIEDLLNYAEVTRIFHDSTGDGLKEAENEILDAGIDDFRSYLRLSAYELARVDQSLADADYQTAKFWYEISVQKFEEASDVIQDRYREELNRIGNKFHQ